MGSKDKNPKKKKGEKSNNFSINNGKTDKIYNSLAFIALIDCILLVVILILEDFFGLLNGEIVDFTENFLMIIGIISTILTFDCIQEKVLSVLLRSGKAGNLITICLLAIAISVIIAAEISKKLKVSSLVRTCIAFVCGILAFISIGKH